MKQKKLLILITLVLFASALAVASSGNFLSNVKENPTAKEWSDDVTHIAFKASEYWRTPSVVGGGSNSFSGIKDISDLGIKASNLKLNYTISEVSDNEFVISSKDIINGSIVQSKVNFQGIAGLPIIKSL